MADRPPLRWQLADDGTGQQALFEEVERHIGRGEFRGMEFLHVNARRIINSLPASARLPFRHTINVYRGCSHACVYCLAGDTPILLADGRTKEIAKVRAGDAVYGTVRIGNYRRYVATPVLDHWETVKEAYRVTLRDGTTLVASADHRFLTDRGWKHVTGSEWGRARRPHLTVNNSLVGTGTWGRPPDPTDDYRRGYLTGMVRGDVFRLALADGEALDRAELYLSLAGVETQAISTSTRVAVDAVRSTVEFPADASDVWYTGFLAGIFDAEGSYSRGVLRIYNTDPAIIDHISEGLRRLAFPFVVEDRNLANGLRVVRITGGLHQHLRFFVTTDPAITRKRTIDGQAIKGTAPLEIAAIEPLGLELPMYDITTGTGDFIANGVVSHNCFARPTHEYLNLDAGRDFETKIVVKVNAVERLRAEIDPRRWCGEAIAMGTNTDPYQRCEGKYHLTRGVIEVLGEAANPFSILTKSTLILRDIDVLTEAAARTPVGLSFSIGTLDDDVWRTTEPGTPHPRRRIEAIAKLTDAGLACSVLMGPVIPGLSDDPDQIDEVVHAALEAGATNVSPITLHLRPGVRELFLPWLERAHPELGDRYRAMYRRAYAPKAVQQRIGALVARSLERHGGRRQRPGAPSRGPDAPSAPTAPRPRPPADDAVQLGLSL